MRRWGENRPRMVTWAVWNRPVDMNNPGMLTPPLLRVVIGQATGVAANGSVTFTSGYTARVDGDTVYVVDDNGRAYMLAPPGDDGRRHPRRSQPRALLHQRGERAHRGLARTPAHKKRPVE